MRKPAVSWLAATVFIVAMFAQFALAAVPAQAAKAVVHLSSPVEIVYGQSQIGLGDIAQVRCSDANLRARLETVVLGPRPIAGSKRKLDRGYIILRMRQQRIAPDDVQFAGPEAVEIVGLAPPVAAAGSAGFGDGTGADGAGAYAAGAGAGTAGASLQKAAAGVAVAKGQAVSMTASLGSISVVTAGRALESGSVGSAIRVEVVESGKVIKATVVAPGQVLYELR